MSPLEYAGSNNGPAADLGQRDGVGLHRVDQPDSNHVRHLRRMRLSSEVRARAGFRESPRVRNEETPPSHVEVLEYEK